MRLKTVLYSSHFQRAFKRLPVSFREEVKERDALFRKNPFDPFLHTHKLTGRLNGFWSFSITSKHRILFQFYEKSSVIFVDVGDHSIYE